MPAANEFAHLYSLFTAPISEFDCGQKCAPYNGGVPFCCDTCHSVPTAYLGEWDYLKANTNLWHIWSPLDTELQARLASEAGSDLILIECLGADQCQRDFRSFACRCFPFFPYFDSRGEFLGLSYDWEYEDRCWIASNLDRVTQAYRKQFISAHDQLFNQLPAEREVYLAHSQAMREYFQAEHRLIPLMHRSGAWYLADPQDESLRPADASQLEKYGPYAIADRLRFPNEI